MDEYSSKGSAVHPIKKYHGLLGAQYDALGAPDATALVERMLECDFLSYEYSCKMWLFFIWGMTKHKILIGILASIFNFDDKWKWQILATLKKHINLFFFSILSILPS